MSHNVFGSEKMEIISPGNLFDKTSMKRES